MSASAKREESRGCMMSQPMWDSTIGWEPNQQSPALDNQALFIRPLGKSSYLSEHARTHTRTHAGHLYSCTVSTRQRVIQVGFSKTCFCGNECLVLTVTTQCLLLNTSPARSSTFHLKTTQAVSCSITAGHTWNLSVQ